MMLIPVPAWVIFYIIVALILGIIPYILADIVEGGIDSLMGKIIFIIGMAAEVFLILFLLGRRMRKKK